MNNLTSTPSLLLIDDDQMSLFIAKTTIKKSGLKAHFFEACNGQEALAFLEMHYQKGNVIDHIFLDLNMPIMNGFEFLKQISVHPFPRLREIPIYILTSSINKADVIEANKSKISGYIEKPLTFDHIQLLFRKEQLPKC
ncbi:MAG: response regulator [Cytophagaceae bacterium]